MIDISHKSNSFRTAIATARIVMRPASIAAIREGRVPKGDPLIVAKVAATQGAKNTQLLIPYCHPMPLDFVGVRWEIGDDYVDLFCEVKAIWKTGVEMEAMTGVIIGAMTIYDMLKMIDDDVVIREVKLVSKSGGKSDPKQTGDRQLRAAVLVLSDSVATGQQQDASGKLIEEKLMSLGIEISDFSILPDDRDTIAAKLRNYADELQLDLVLTTGGTGLGPRDLTPEAMRDVIDHEIPGIMEAIRSYGQSRTPFAMLSRAMAGQRGKTIIINLPGSRRAVAESLAALFPTLLHAFKMIDGGGHSS